MYPFIHIFGFEIESYLVLYVIAFIVATFLLRHELKRNDYPPYLYIVLLITAVITGMIGSKIYYLFEVWDSFIMSPAETFFNLAGSGWYGGFILAGVSIAALLKIKKFPVLKTLDVIIPVLPLTQAIGRIGCFLAGCCHGSPADVPWAMSFPRGLYPPDVKVHPTQLYEILIYLCVFVLLWTLRKKEIKYGIKAGLYLILAGLGRFIVEFYRLNPKVVFRLTAPQIIALSGAILGVVIILLCLRRASRRANFY